MTAEPTPIPARRAAAWAAGLFALTLALYWPATGFEFVRYDDDLYVLGVPEVRSGLTGEGVRWAFTSFQGANWFPLTRLSWMLDAQLFGLEPGAFHRTNALLHATAAALFLLALTRLSGALAASAWVAAVFALHPLHVESVAWVASRKDVLSGVFAAAALLAYAGAARRGGVARHALVFALLGAGLMAKPTLVVWPCVLLLLDAWPLRRLGPGARPDPASLRRVVLEKLPLFALALAAAALTVLAQAEGEALRTLESIPPGRRVANAFAALAAYGADAFWPRGLAVYYPLPATPPWGAAAAGAAFAIGGSGVALTLWRRAPAVAVGWLWFLVALVPVLGLVQVGQAARADRYTYLPLLGLALALAWGLPALVSRHARRALAALALLALFPLAAASRVQLETWRDSDALFRHALTVTEDNHVAHINLGLDLLERGALDEASAHLSAALRIAPASPYAAGLLADVRVRQGRSEEAIGLYRRALAIDPDAPRWRQGLARALLARERPEEALRVLRDPPEAGERR